MDQDRKSTALKNLQGKIWQEGYRSGELHGEVYPDVPPALERWHRAGTDVRIYSSGSILAQQLIFSTTRYGDLTRFLSGYFDTTTGPKRDAASYSAIAAAFALSPFGDSLYLRCRSRTRCRNVHRHAGSSCDSARQSSSAVERPCCGFKF
jgi:2,3-diketo-5-methylthio-1-phosphopentane phosphatase